MEFQANQDVALPIAAVWREVTQFELFEAGLRKRDVVLTRHGDDAPREGTVWSAEVPFAGRALKAEARIAEMDAPRVLRLEGYGTGIDGAVDIKLSQVDQSRTKIQIAASLSARAIGAQVILQPLKLARGKLQTQFEEQAGRIARAMEARHAAAQTAAGSGEASDA